MSKTFQALNNEEYDVYINRAELLQKSGHFPHLTVYELAEMLYYKSIESQEIWSYKYN